MTEGLPPCRSCNERALISILSLGRMPLANALLTADQLDQPEEVFPLELAFCTRCALVQITETVPPEKLFREYLYFSSYSDTMIEHARRLVEQAIPMWGLDEHSLVVELASNDGYLLQFYRQAGIPVLGIEPAENVARVAEEKRGIPTLCEFFSEVVAKDLVAKGRSADIIHAHNVLAHVADLNGFVEGIAILLKAKGVAIIEVPYIKDLIDRCEFDTIYHEHLCYYSLAALDRLFQRHGLKVQEVERVPIHGGSLLLFVARMEASDRGQGSAQRLREEEHAWGVDQAAYYLGFARRVEELKLSLVQLMGDLKHSGHHLAAYGAAAKGSTLLNYTGIGGDILDFVVDRSIHKQGRYVPGVHLPVFPPERLLDAMPDYVLLLAWNFADEIMAQQAEFRRRGGRFVLPVPEPKVVER
jgi:SAM-dependent methyltransferase